MSPGWLCTGGGRKSTPRSVEIGECLVVGNHPPVRDKSGVACTMKAFEVRGLVGNRQTPPSQLRIQDVGRSSRTNRGKWAARRTPAMVRTRRGSLRTHDVAAAAHPALPLASSDGGGRGRIRLRGYKRLRGCKNGGQVR